MPYKDTMKKIIRPTYGMAAADARSLRTTYGWRKQKLVGVSGRNLGKRAIQSRAAVRRAAGGKAELMESVGRKANSRQDRSREQERLEQQLWCQVAVRREQFSL